MRAKKRIQLKRKPLSDCTNDVVATTPRQNPRPPRQSQSPGDIGRCGGSESEPSTVYTRRKRSRPKENEQRKAVGLALIRGSSLIGIKNFGEEDEAGIVDSSNLPKVLQRKKKRQEVEQDASEDCLNGYLEQQRVYFEAVDAEELEEEVESDKEENGVYHLGDIKA